MSIDWSAISTIIGLVTAIIAVGALILETRRSRVALQTEALLSLVEKMDSPEVKTFRMTAAQKLLAHEMPNYELSDVLDFFGTIAFLADSGAIDFDLTYKEFSWWIVRYWASAEDYIKKEREIDVQGWVTLEKVVKRLVLLEKKSGYPPESYSSEALHAFLLEEAKIAETQSPEAKVELAKQQS